MTNLQTLADMGQRVADLHVSVDERRQDISDIMRGVEKERDALLAHINAAFAQLTARLSVHHEELRNLMGVDIE